MSAQNCSAVATWYEGLDSSIDFNLQSTASALIAKARNRVATILDRNNVGFVN